MEKPRTAKDALAALGESAPTPAQPAGKANNGDGDGSARERLGLGPTSWIERDLAPALSGEIQFVRPEYLARTDGEALLYPRKVHAFVGESESMKTWAALFVCAERIEAGEHVVVVDFEDDEGTFVQRLRQLGIADVDIRAQAHFLAPNEPMHAKAAEDLVELLERVHPTLVIIDGVTEIMGIENLDPDRGKDTAQFLVRIPRMIAAHGPAVVLIDHVVKDSKARGRYASGSVHKLNGLDGAQYVFQILRSFGEGQHGMSALTVEKDRRGAIRGFATGKQVGVLNAWSNAVTGEVRIELHAPGSAEAQPTVLMERISRFLEEYPAAASGKTIEDNVTGKGDGIRWAIRVLVKDGFVEASAGPQRAIFYESIKPYRDAEIEFVPSSSP